MTRMAAAVEKIAVEQRISVDSLSGKVGLVLEIDTLGRVTEWRFADNMSEGRDHTEIAPVTASMRRIVTQAYDHMEGTWSPARFEDGHPVAYTLRMGIRIPVAKIERAVNPDPLLFMGEQDPEIFRKWLRERVRYHESQIARGQEGRVDIEFWVEANGEITIEKISSPVTQLEKETARVIRKSRGKWTPRKVEGVAQRTNVNLSFVFSGN